MSLRGGRNFLRPTRQSLTERNGIPERSLEKQREAVCVLHARHHLVFLVSCSRIKQQAGANRSVCSCFLPPDGLSAQPPCSAAFQRSCVLHRAFSYGPSAHSADRIPARTEKLPGRTERRLRLAGQPTKSFAGRLVPPFSAFLQRTRWLVLQTQKKCAIISVSKR